MKPAGQSTTDAPETYGACRECGLPRDRSHSRRHAARMAELADCCTMCGVPYDGSPLVLDHHAAGPHWHDPDGVTLHYRLSPDAAQREDRLATPAVTETEDAILWEAVDSDHMLRVGAITRERGRYVLWSGAQRVWSSPLAERDPIDAYLASPEAVEQLAVALSALPPIPDEFLLHKTWVESDWLPNAREYAIASLAALRKVRAGS